MLVVFIAMILSAIVLGILLFLLFFAPALASKITSMMSKSEFLYGKA